MSDIHIHRAHTLGLRGARQVAAEWSEKAQKKLEMACAYAEGEDGDELQFSRPGVKGTLRVCSDHFELNAHLGFLLSAFKDQIESEIAKNLDELLTKGGKKAGVKKPASG
jgi:putative polyhydroxyalkanoate system protein